MTSASLIIPTRGGAERLPVLFDALAQQTHAAWDAIVVVDGDIDNTRAIVERYAHLPVRAIVLPENRGRVTALNTGFDAATGDVLIRCDDDFEPSPGHVAAHVQAHEVRECGVVGLPLNVAPENAYMRVYGRDADERSRASAYGTPPDQRWRLWGGNTSVTRDVFRRVGGFDTRYRGYGWEDLDFGYRLAKLGIPIDLVREAEVRHHMASVNTTQRAMRAFRSGQARRRFDEIHGTGVSKAAANDEGSVWNRTVRALAARLTDDRTRKLAAGIDFALPILPTPVGRKVVALGVEAAGVAGFDHGRGDDRVE